jgi:hypothetical protein
MIVPDIPVIGPLRKKGMVYKLMASGVSFPRSHSLHFPSARQLAIWAGLTAVAWLGSKALASPDTRSWIAWAVRTWFRPPDAEAGWEQQHG